MVVVSVETGAQTLLPVQAWRQILGQARLCRFEAGEFLFEQESVGDSLWLVRAGTVELYKTFFGEKHRLAYTSRGAVIGEGSLFESTVRATSARATTEVRAYEVNNQLARLYLQRYPALALSLLQSVSHRSRRIEESLVEQLVQRNLELQMHQRRLDPQMRRRVKDLEKTNEHLHQLAWIDALTGCHNRRSLEKVLEIACESADRFALAMFDVDHFKHYNDNNGHLEGDRALQALVLLLQRRLRTNDVLARYGGEEFCLILRDVSATVASVVCERLRCAITEFAFPFEDRQPLGDFTVSMGLALYPLEAKTPAQLLQLADERLYQAKHQGRNRLVGGSYAGL